MDSENVITFCQADLHSSSFSALDEMRKREELCDLTIRIQDHSFAAHKVVLAAAFPYFRSMFTTAAGKEQEGLGVGNLDPTALESLISFAYSSKITISAENVYSLLVASQFLQLITVRNACVEFLSVRLRIDNVLEIRTLACKLNDPKLTESTYGFMRKNFEKVWKSEEFLSLPHSCIKEIISADDLNVSSEETVFEAVMQWVKVSSSERQAMLPELLSEVRMVYLPGDYLIKQVAREELVRSSKRCTDLIDEVKNYHMLPKERSVFPNLKTIPRKCNGVITNKALYAVSEDSSKICLKYYDFVNESWPTLSSMLHNDTVVHVVAVNENIYVFCILKIVVVRVKTLEWEILAAPLPEGTGAEAAVVFHKSMIYFFGSGSYDFRDAVLCFDTKRNIWLKDGRLITGKSNCAAVSVGEFIYVIGGFIYTKQNVLFGREVVKYNASTGQWSETASMLTERARHSCSCMNGKIFVCGGYSKKDGIRDYNTPSAEVYDPITNQWNFICDMQTARYDFSLISYGGKIYAFGGKSNKEPKAAPVRNKDTEVYDPETDRWEPGSNVNADFMGVVLCSAAT